MFMFIVRRLLLAIPTLALVTIITFTLGFYAPGDPIVAMYGEQMPPSPEALEQMRQAYGLDRPYLVQLGDYALRAVQAVLQPWGVTLAELGDWLTEGWRQGRLAL